MKSKLILAKTACLLLLTFSASNLSAQSQVCKCGPDCKCRTNSGEGSCKCGPGCKCHNHAAMNGHNHQSSENAFLRMMDAMMMKMDSVPLTSSAERNFLVQMIPHHQGALEMASYEIEHGTDFEMVQLAKSILAEQTIEIMEMMAMTGNYAAEGTVLPDYTSGMNKAMMVMMNKTPKDSDLTGNTDCSFAMVMLPHHQAAVDMAVVLLNLSAGGPVTAYAKRIIADQLIEIGQMTNYIQTKCKK